MYLLFPQLFKSEFRKSRWSVWVPLGAESQIFSLSPKIFKKPLLSNTEFKQYITKQAVDLISWRVRNDCDIGI